MPFAVEVLFWATVFSLGIGLSGSILIYLWERACGSDGEQRDFNPGGESSTLSAPSKILHRTAVLEALCKATQKWGLYINIFLPEDCFDFREVVKAAAFLDLETDGQVLADEEGWILFDDEESMLDAFDSCVGDDGPTHLNSYNGPIRVYALTCSPEGQLLNENT